MSAVLVRAALVCSLTLSLLSGMVAIALPFKPLGRTCLSSSAYSVLGGDIITYPGYWCDAPEASYCYSYIVAPPCSGYDENHLGCAEAQEYEGNEPVNPGVFWGYCLSDPNMTCRSTSSQYICTYAFRCQFLYDDPEVSTSGECVKVESGGTPYYAPLCE